MLPRKKLIYKVLNMYVGVPTLLYIQICNYSTVCKKTDRIYKKITIKLYLFIYIYIYICIFVCIYICIYVYTSLLLGGEEKGDFPASAAAIVKAGSKQFNKEAVISIFPIRTSTGIFAK
jgi:hypothetical protein